MKVSFFFLIISLLAGISCKEDKKEIIGCRYDMISGSNDLNTLVAALPDYVLEALTNNPDANGALGRNKSQYFHVRFQMDLGFLAYYACNFKSEAALEKFILSAEYSFEHQKPAGDFEFVIPEELQYLGPPATSDILSGTSFFLSSLGTSLVLLNQSEWFVNRPDNVLRQRLTQLSGKFQLALDYLKREKELLMMYDNDAANRLFYDALAFYSMGKYLNDDEAKSIGTEFIELALRKQDTAGFFAEDGGFDTSYNGVSIRLGMVLLGIVDADNPVYPDLKKSLSCSLEWQASKVLGTGEISLEGNTRVYPGGETFLGHEKQIAWTESLQVFYFAYALSSNGNYQTIAKKIEAYYG